MINKNNLYYEQPCLASRLSRAIDNQPLEAPLLAWQSQALINAVQHDGALANARKVRLALLRSESQGFIV